MTRQRTGFAVLDDKPKTQERRQRAVQAELRALPELEAPGTVWRTIEKRLDSVHRPQRWHAGYGLAAGAAAAALIAAILLIDRNPAPAPQRVAGAAAPEALVAELMERSRLAESRRRALPAMLPEIEDVWVAPVPGIEARRLLAARIAAVDASLNRLAAAPPADAAERERLWRERAELMDTLMRAEQVQREDYFRRAVH